MNFAEQARLCTITGSRLLLSLRRSSAKENLALLAQRSETPASLTVRLATAADIPALAALHVRTWNDTYAPFMTGPPASVREQQWREAFGKHDGSWFCHVLARPNGELAGFAKGVFRTAPAEYPGELNKLFLDRPYQRLGLGTRLLGRAVNTFLERGVTSMSAFVEPVNPSCWFFEAMGGTWQREHGRINFNWYVWSDLESLAERCDPDANQAEPSDVD